MTAPTTHNARLNSAICNYVAQHQPCGTDALFAVFGDCPTHAPSSVAYMPKKRFSARIHMLLGLGCLRNIAGNGSRRQLVPGDVSWQSVMAARAAKRAGQTPRASAAPAWAGQKAPPRQYDVMRAPVYVPGPGMAMRPGADAFLHCPSRNGSQWVPHRTGYVAALASNHTTPTTPTTP